MADPIFLFLAYWTHDLSPFALRFSETFGIRWYGLAYVAGFLTAYGLLALYHRRGRSPLTPSHVSDLMVALVLGVFVGGRLGYFLLYRPETLLTSPLDFFKVWEGGMASHGGFAGVILALAWFVRSRGLPFLTVGDLVASVVPPGLFFGRLANFVNGELWGKESYVSWAVIFPDSGTLVPRHPSQLYEAALEGLVLFAYVQHRLWRNRLPERRPGQLAGEFLVGYAVLRAVGELFRHPDAGTLLGLSRGTFYSLFLALLGVVLIVRARRKPLSPPDSAPRLD